MTKTGKKNNGSDYIFSIATKVITAVVGVVASSFSTRYLGVAYKGDYGYICQVSNIAMLVLNMGVYQSYSYNYKKLGKETLKKYTDICFLQFSVLLLAAVVLTLVLKDPLIVLATVLVPFNILKNQYENIVLIENIGLRMKLHIFNSVLLAAAYAGLFFFADTKLSYIVGLTVAADVLTVVIYCVRLRCVPKPWKVDLKFMKSVLRFGFIPMLSALLATVNYSIDIIFLKHIGIPQELSYYSLAANIINYVWMIPDAFKDVLFSRSARKFDKDSITFSSQISLGFIVLCFAGFAVLGKFLLKIVYGAEFVSSYGVTLLLMAGAFSMSLFKLIGIVLVSQGRRIAHFVSLAVSAAVNVILNFILIPVLGMYGAGIASVCSYTVCALILLVYFCRVYSVSPLQMLLPSRKTVRSLLGFFGKKK